MTEIVLYDLRSSNVQDAFIQSCNRSMADDGANQYLNEHGAIGSEKWWSDFDADRITLKTLSGPVTHIGPRNNYFGEMEDVVCFDANGTLHCYDRDGVWADNRIQIGDKVSVLRTKATVPHRNGDYTWLIDVRISLEKNSNDDRDSGQLCG